MADLVLRFRNAAREPLADRLDVRVRVSSTNQLVAHEPDFDGRKLLRMPALANRVYVVTAHPRRHRPVGQNVMMPADGDHRADLHFPLHPDFVQPAFRPYADLPADLTTVLESSSLEGRVDRGRALYDSLSDIQRAGLLNLFCKMQAFGFDETHTVWSFVTGIYRIRPDRIFADVDVALRDRVKGAEVEDRFREVNGALHTPPPDFRSAGSFKTDDRYGNLQLSFFSSTAAPIAFKVDADIDDAAGIGHAFQVLRNSIKDRTTHPYDIHQILVFRQEAQPPYKLA